MMTETNYRLSLLLTYARKELRELVRVDKMSPDDRAKLFDELSAIFVRRLLGELSSDENTAYSKSNRDTPRAVSLRSHRFDLYFTNVESAVIVREGMAEALLGAILVTVATVWAYILPGNLAVAIAVGVSLLT